jgi:4-hydroxybenzoate polyprenyltransferase
MLYEIQPDFKLICASFLLIFSTYSLNKLTDIKADSINLPQRTAFIRKNKRYLIFMVIVSYAAALTLCAMQSPYAVVLILCPLLTGVIYSIKVRNFRLKDIIGLKSVSIGICWASGMAFLPLTVYSKELITVCLIFYFFFIRSIINTILFDVRDKAGDSVHGVKTIPVFLGINNTKKLLILLNSTMILWLIACYLLGVFNGYLSLLVLSVVYEYWCILRFCRPYTRSERSMEVLIHSECIMFAILVALLHIWRSNPLSFVKLAQVASVLNNEFLSCASVWVVSHVYFGFSLFSVPFLIYAARKINRLLAVEGESRYLLNRTFVLHRNR